MTSSRTATQAELERRLVAVGTIKKAADVHPATIRVLHRTLLDALLDAERTGVTQFGIHLGTPSDRCDHFAHQFYTDVFRRGVHDRWRVEPTENIAGTGHCGWIFSR